VSSICIWYAYLRCWSQLVSISRDSSLLTRILGSCHNDCSRKQSTSLYHQSLLFSSLTTTTPPDSCSLSLPAPLCPSFAPRLAPGRCACSGLPRAGWRRCWAPGQLSVRLQDGARMTRTLRRPLRSLVRGRMVLLRDDWEGNGPVLHLEAIRHWGLGIANWHAFNRDCVCHWAFY